MQVLLFVTLLGLVFGGIAWMRISAQRATPEETRRVLAERAAWIAANRIGLGLAFSGGLMAVLGVAMWAHAMLGETVTVELTRLEAGDAIEATFPRVHGFARGEFAVCRDTRGVRTCHTPLTSTAHGTTVAVLLSSGSPVAGEGDHTGMASTDDVWGLDELRARGLAIAPGAFVLVRGETPEERRPMGLVIFAVGAALGSVGGLMLARARNAAR